MIRQINYFISRFQNYSVLLLIGFLLITSFYYYQNSLSLHFVDEEHNIVLGTYLLKGEKLYSDMFNNHQPIAHILSAGIQKATDPNSIYLLIKRHREFMIIWTFIWALILFKRFSSKIIPFICFYELSKILLLGNLFLSESIIIYPLIYLTGLVFQNKVHKLEYIFIGFLFAFVAFTFAPTWPILFLLLLMLIFRHLKKRANGYKLLLLGGLPILAIVLFFSSINEYFFDVFYINSKYYIPYGVENGTEKITVLSFITPILSFFTTLNSESKMLINYVSLLLIYSLLILFKRKNYLYIFSIVAILGLANLRYIEPGSEYYRGFHLLPWFALLIFLSSYFGSELLVNTSKKIRIIAVIILLLILGQSLVIAKNHLFIKPNVQRDLYINYSQQFDSGIIVNLMKDDNEVMLVSPDEWLIYWQADINHPPKLINFYEWMVRSPELKQMVDNLFLYNPPTYLYCNCKEDSYLLSNLKNYQQIRKDGSLIPLYVLDSKLKNLDSKQKEDLKFYNVIVN